MRRSTRAKRMLKTPLSAWRRGWKPRSGSRPLTGRVISVHNHNLIFFRSQNPDPQFWTSKFNHWLDPRENLDLDVISVIISSSDFFYERSWQETVFIHCFCVNIFLYLTCLSQIKRNIYAFLNVNFFFYSRFRDDSEQDSSPNRTPIKETTLNEGTKSGPMIIIVFMYSLENWCRKRGLKMQDLINSKKKS